MTVEALTALGEQVRSSQVIMPNHQSGSFVGDDTDNHDFIFKGRGKSVLNFQVDNAPNQTLSWALYGMHEVGGAVGDPGTFPIDNDTGLADTKIDEGFMGYTFPFYLLRLSFAVTPTDNPLETVSVYVDLTVGI